MSNSRQELLLIFAALAFSLIANLSLSIQMSQPTPLILWSLAAAIGLGTHIGLNRFASQRDPLLLPIAILLTSWGLIILLRVAPNFVQRQMLWIATGMLALVLVAASRDRLRWLRRYKYTWLLFSLALLAATLILGINPSGSGARLWLGIAGVFLQPSEVLRLLLVAFLAAFLAERTGLISWQALPFVRKRHTHTDRRSISLHNLLAYITPLAPSIVMWFVAVILLVTQQDLGAAMLLLLTYAFIIYLATGHAALPITGLAVLGAAAAIGYSVSSRIALRINIWLNPWLDPQETSFQIVQSLISVASGGILGQGIGQGSPDFVPAVHTDFPYAAIGEEFGLFGMLAILCIYAVLALRAWRIANKANSAYALLLAGGIAALFTTQPFVIIGGNLGILPITGVTLPFVSYGGSSLLVSLVAVGLLVRLSADQTDDKYSKSGVTLKVGSTAIATTEVLSIPHLNQRRAVRCSMFFTAGLFLCLALSSTNWAYLQADRTTARSDNPRNLINERAIRRGDILARDGTVLVTSQLVPQDDVFAKPVYSRIYTHPQTAPLVGYYSNRYGITGLELQFDDTLRGSNRSIDKMLHRPQIGSSVTTTIDLKLQSQLLNAMRGNVGSGIVLDWQTGEVLALASLPTFDPNVLDADWSVLRDDRNAPLLNRATQGLYQPGNVLRWIYTEQHTVDGTVAWDNTDRYQLSAPVAFELANAAVPYPTTVTYSETIGQGSLRITPLRLSVVAASLAAQRTITPTLQITNKTTQDHAEPAITSDQIIVAQTGNNAYVGWYIKVIASTVTVLAIELPSSDQRPVQDVRERLTIALPTSR